jgi:hypothetical protein
MLSKSNAKTVEPAVFQLHLTLVKTLVIKSISTEDRDQNNKKALLQDDDEEMNEVEINSSSDEENEE